MGGGGKSGGSAASYSPPPPPPPPVQEDYGVDKSSLYNSAAKAQKGSAGRRGTILTGTGGDESSTSVKKNMLLGG